MQIEQIERIVHCYHHLYSECVKGLGGIGDTICANCLIHALSLGSNAAK